jgi:transcriptional regulator with XRE-family HTH domain
MHKMAPKNPPEPMQIAAQLTSPRFVIVSGEVVRRLRMERGMTQLQLARAAGYTERLIRKAEKGGRLDIRTVQNLAEALSQFGNHLSVEILLKDNLAIAKLCVEKFDELGPGMLASIESCLSDDFILNCPGDPQAIPFAGTFAGATGFQLWLDRYFSVFTRQTPRELEFTVGSDTVVARWIEHCSISGFPCRPIRMTMYFRFRDGLIVRMDDDYDTKACEDAILKVQRQQADRPRT